MKELDLSLYFVTESVETLTSDFFDLIEQAIQGGATAVQFRNKIVSDEDYLKSAKRIADIVKPLGIPLILNDRVHLMKESKADGVHLGQSDMPAALARKKLGKKVHLGLSVECIDQIAASNQLDVDYIGVSPVFPTSGKDDVGEPFGLKGLMESVKLSIHPTVGIGGICLDNVRDVVSTGVDGIAVVSAISRAPNPFHAALKLKAELSNL